MTKYGKIREPIVNWWYGYGPKDVFDPDDWPDDYISDPNFVLPERPYSKHSHLFDAMPNIPPKPREDWKSIKDIDEKLKEMA